MRPYDVVTFKQYYRCPHCDEILEPAALIMRLPHAGHLRTMVTQADWCKKIIVVERLGVRALLSAVLRTSMRNFYWTIVSQIFEAGFLDTPLGDDVSWRHLTWKWRQTRRNRCAAS